MPVAPTPVARLDAIALARKHVMQHGTGLTEPWVAPWVERSWRRCLQGGLSPTTAVEFAHVTPTQATQTQQANRWLHQAAQPILHNLARAIVNTRYFAILTNAQGVVVDACGAIDHTDPRAHLITRVGTDLSERSLGTTAIGTALAELQPVWLHRGEHFFDTNASYSCAGAPLFGPDGRCVGMLDVTGVDVQERPELKHLVMQSASKIENALLTALPHALLLRLGWPGNMMGSDADGLVCLDADGQITGANANAHHMVPGLTTPQGLAGHHSDVFGVPVAWVFDAARHGTPFELPLWSGLRLQAQALLHTQPDGAAHCLDKSPSSQHLPLRDLEANLIRKAVADAHGNVMEAARALGISRATVYRKLGKPT